MYLITPTIMTDALLSASSVPETDHPVWAVGTTYGLGDRVIVLSTHSIYQSAIAGNLGNNPVSNPTQWVRVGATNRWRAFDGKIGDLVTQASDISYTIVPAVNCNAVALFGLSASSVRVVVVESAITIYDQTFPLVDNTGVIDAWTYHFGPVIYDSELVVQGIPAYAGTTVTVTVIGTGTRQLGELVIGVETTLGELVTNGTVGITDYSRKERDVFGNYIINERAFADRVDYPFFTTAADIRRIKRALVTVRAKPAVFHGGQEYSRFGLTTYGFFTDFEAPLVSLDATFITLEIEGLI